MAVQCFFEAYSNSLAQTTLARMSDAAQELLTVLQTIELMCLFCMCLYYVCFMLVYYLK